MAGDKIKVADGLVNFVANLGTDRDKASHAGFVDHVYTDVELVAAYRTSWAAKKIVNIPPRDATREWRSWQAEKDQIEKIEKIEKAHNLQGKVEDALRRARLSGGAAIYIGTNAADPSAPLLPSEKIKYLRVLGKSKLSGGETEDDISSEYFGEPRYYTLTTARATIEIHPSRLVRFVGDRVPDDDMGTGIADGWGDSVLGSCMAAILRAEATMANSASLVYEAKVDVLGIPDLMDQMADPVFEGNMLKRIQLAAMAKGINGMLLLDSAETHETKNASFGGLPELIEKFMQEVSGASDIPATRLLGQAPAGMSATGESDLRNYYDRIKADQGLTITPALAKLDELVIWNALGSRPEEVHYNWNPLWQATATEAATIGKSIADTISILNGTALFNSNALSRAATNMLTERGVVPGLEGAMEEFENLEEDPAEGPEEPESPAVF